MIKVKWCVTVAESEWVPLSILSPIWRICGDRFYKSLVRLGGAGGKKSGETRWGRDKMLR